MKVYCPKCKSEFDDFSEEHSTICTKCGQKLLLTLNQLLKDQGPMPAEDAAAMMTKIASAVHFAAAFDIIHHDEVLARIFVLADIGDANNAWVLESSVVAGFLQEPLNLDSRLGPIGAWDFNRVLLVGFVGRQEYVRETAISDQSNQAVARQLDRYSRGPSGVDGTPILRFRRSVGFNLIRLSAVLPVRLNCQR